ncbi:hypothetical protein AK830_g10046 [Neonectria ditissima]|uniref:Zn(2)-C6 fungal-type domain-containing protein n=1 Tax=Neonectria ditissima TaxID=78410 RepID=A0A0P7B7W4_9HYPO|nr:hypothetical protein AK830_g10046 [Neonectria ditissima]
MDTKKGCDLLVPPLIHARQAMRRSRSPLASPLASPSPSAGQDKADADGHGKLAAGTGKRPQTLARRACDACRARRRKCVFADEHLQHQQQHPLPPPQSLQAGEPNSSSQQKCQDCLRLGISCSFLVPTRTRGPKRSGDEQQPVQQQPPNPVEAPAWQFTTVQAESRNDIRPLAPIVDHSSPYGHSQLSIDGSRHAASPALTAQNASPSMAGPRFPTDELCSRALLNIIMNDYLDLIYPLVPVVHRPSFRADLASNRDLTDPDFLAIVIAIAALTVGLLPSRFPVYRAMAPDVAMRFDTRMAMINCCVDMCMRVRNFNYWDHVSLRKWAVCYLLSVGCFQTGQTNRSRMLEVESMQIGRLLGLHRVSDYDGLNCIEVQLRKKAFWLMFYTYAHSMLQCGRQERLAFLDHSMMHEVNFESLFPLDLDDEQILEKSILGPPSPATSPSVPAGTQAQPAPLSLTSGFILHSRVFFKGAQEVLYPGNCDWERRHSPQVRLSRLRDLLQEVRYMLDDVPGPMRQWASTGDYRASDSPVDGFPSRPGFDDLGRIGMADVNDANAKALPGQVEIMRANLHGTHLWLQSLLLDQIDVLLQKISQRADSSAEMDSHTAALKASWTEREDVCRQMLHLLHSMPYAHLEPNGLYLTYKVRDVGVTLLNCPYEAHERPARRAAEYMQDFTRALSRLDRSEIVNTNSLKSWIDVDRERAP